ncbi:hypothetical protein IP93_02998 [Lysobacter ruishenii]|uniref:Uncharacterized protein n=1 Tax=Aerolutibacter ruishenii TaxID=686800 RepID=A0A562LFI3_9GAMM|nr:hypothetical protein IP93_02998 [Lysobacter ruishenii]
MQLLMRLKFGGFPVPDRRYRVEEKTSASNLQQRLLVRMPTLAPVEFLADQADHEYRMQLITLPLSSMLAIGQW